MTAVIPLAALLVLLGWLGAKKLRTGTRASLAQQRQIAGRARLDVYRPHWDDRFGDDWFNRHGGL